MKTFWDLLPARLFPGTEGNLPIDLLHPSQSWDVPELPYFPRTWDEYRIRVLWPAPLLSPVPFQFERFILPKRPTDPETVSPEMLSPEPFWPAGEIQRFSPPDAPVVNPLRFR